MALQWMLLLLLTPQLAAQNRGKPYPNNYGKAQGREKCQQPQWDSQLQFRPNQGFYRISEEVTLSCFVNDAPTLAVIRCANRKNPWEVLDTSGKGHRLTQNLSCTTAKCPKPQWDARLQFLGNETEYPQNRELTLTCPKGLEPSFPEVTCAKEIQGVSSGKPVYVDAWWSRSSTGAWTRIEGDVLCMGGCKRPQWDPRLQMAPNQENYEKDEKVMLSCPEGFHPPFTEIQCQTQFYDDYGTLGYKEFWLGRDSRGAWVRIQSSVECIGGCKRPQWDSRLQLAPDQENYEKDENVTLRCPEGFHPPFTEIQCQTQFYDDYGTLGYKEFWLGRDSRGAWVRIQSSVECIGQTVGQWHWIVIGLVVLLVDRLVVAVILWLVHSRKRKYLPNKTKEDN